ncbi:MAG: ArsI/CadI family heavy metal resistance metalloenzyme [Candidatus Cyclobacteriaceae bacterium M2_1C_046]
MKRFHVHLKVKDLQESISFYTALFNIAPAVEKSDYAKWMLNEPAVNFALSSGHSKAGIEHLGLQVDSPEELEEVYSNMKNAKGMVFKEGDSTCCYSKSQKSWVTDPQGVDWEAFHTYGESTLYGEGRNARPSPEAMESWTGNDSKNAALPESKTAEGCCK